MKKYILAILCLNFLWSCSVSHSPSKDTNVTALSIESQQKFTGNFVDDYGIEYHITNKLWVQQPNIEYHILVWNEQEQYIIAQNGKNNPSEKGLFTRIDLMPFEDMGLYKWGFCLTKYDAKTKAEAIHIKSAQRATPKTGCNGYPFSRMKVLVQKD